MKKLLDKLKRPIFFLEDHYPCIGSPLIKFLRDIRFLFYKFLFILNKSHIKKNDIFKTYWVDPQLIQYCYSGKFNVVKDRGTIKGGNWDLSEKKFSDTETYRGLEERFIQHKQWKQTKFYNDVLKSIEKGGIKWHCTNKEQWENRLKLLDGLYQDMKMHGYEPYHDRKNNNRLDTYNGMSDEHYSKIDEVLISIGRNGQLLFNDGAHRLAIAKILRISKIAVMILVRHKKWMQFKAEVKSYAQHLGGKLYQPAYFFDLSDIPFVYGPERFNLIKSNTSLLQGSVLDIGSNFGYFCHKFEQSGFNCYAVEIDPRNVYFMRKLKAVNRDHFTIVEESILNYKKGQKLKYDIVLALNIFHHFLQRKSTYNKLKALLRRLECQEMFFETHNPGERQMEGAFRNYGPEDFVNFILKNSYLNKYTLLKEFKDGRRLYKIVD